MKKNLFLLILIAVGFSPNFALAQLKLSDSANLVINSGSTVITESLENSGGTIVNNGTLEIKGNLENNSTALFESSSTGTLKFTGAAAQEITGNTDADIYGTVEINNSNGVILSNTSTGSDLTINGTLQFLSGNLTLNNFNLEVNDISGAGSSTGYVVTNGTGLLKREVNNSKADVVFPVGNSTYNPVTLNNSGTDDTYGVRVLDHEPANASTAHMVDRTWEITEETAGGSNLTVTPQWNATEELTDFDRTSSQVGLTTDDGNTYTWASVGAASGSGPYTRSGAGFTSVGKYTVGDYYFGGLNLTLKIYLAGAYDATNHNMTKTLLDNSLIPTTDPYGINKTVSNFPTNAVDWVEVQLRSNQTDTTAKFAAFVDQNGNVIEEDGSALAITGVEKGDYYISVHHRNHLPVMSANKVTIGTNSSYDFTTALTQAWNDANVTSNAAMKEVESGKWGLWSGDVNQDGYIKYNGTNADRTSILSVVGSSTPANTISNTYNANDVNMDGSVKYNGTNADRTSVLSVIGSSTPANTYQAHLPN